MEPIRPPRPTTPQVEIVDEQGRFVGVIATPVTTDVLGPGRETVYLARPADRTPHVA